MAGGYQNAATAPDATVGGGNLNTASGNYAMVPGGYNNHAEGAYSFAGGDGSEALHSGSFVWSDSSGSGNYDNSPNQFSVAAKGGIVLNSTGAEYGIASGINLNSGTGELTLGGGINLYTGPNTLYMDNSSGHVEITTTVAGNNGGAGLLLNYTNFVGASQPVGFFAVSGVSG